MSTWPKLPSRRYEVVITLDPVSKHTHYVIPVARDLPAHEAVKQPFRLPLVLRRIVQLEVSLPDTVEGWPARRAGRVALPRWWIGRSGAGVIVSLNRLHCILLLYRFFFT